MVPKHIASNLETLSGFRAVLFRMVPKLFKSIFPNTLSFRAVLFRMVPKPGRGLHCYNMVF